MPSALTPAKPRRRRLALVPIAGLALGVVLATTLPGVASAGQLTVGADTFSRTLSNGWGTAERGGPWWTYASGRATTSVASRHARFNAVAPGGSAEALLTKMSAQNVDMKAMVFTPTASATTYTAVELRRQSDGSQLRGRLELDRKGYAVLSLTKVYVDGKKKKVEVGLGKVTLPFTVKPGTAVYVEFRAIGTTKVAFSGRAWIAGKATPDWQITVNDSSSTRIVNAGQVGFWQYAGGSNSTAVSTAFDNVTVVKDPTVVSVVTPVAPAKPAGSTTGSGTGTGTTTPVTAPPATTAPTPPATTAPVVTAPAPVTSSEDSRGSATVGTTDYAVPANALFVSPTGSDSAAGTIGSPKQTVSGAVAAAKSGQTIVIRAGVYNEHVDIPTNKTLTIQSYPHEAVWFDGSQQVTNWTQSGSTWTTPWNFFPSSAIQGIPDNPRFVNSGAPLASRRDQAFVNGTPLTQVATAAAVVPGTFAVDSKSKTVTIGTNPAGQEVRVSNVGQAIKVNSVGTTLRGFGVRRYANSSDEGGAVKLANANGTAENLDIENSAGIGINVENNNETLNHLTVLHSGLMGVGANAAYNFKLTNSVIQYANDQFFSPAPVSGGFKITRSRGVIIDNNDVSHNYSSGIWLDESVYDAQITNNTANDDKYVAISLELSQKVIVANNTMNGSYSGVTVVDTGDVQIYNNMIGGTSSFGIQGRQDERRASQLSVPGHDARQPLPDPTMPWVTKDVMIANNVFGSGTGYQIYALNAAPKNITITGNVFNNRVTSAQSTLVAWGGPDTSKYVRYDSPQAIAQGINSSWVNAQTSGVVPLAQMASIVASAQSIATPVPADVAALIGQKAGVKHVGTF